ncbi:hypothetical protein ACLOJK_026620 [Asimina triloba]
MKFGSLTVKLALPSSLISKCQQSFEARWQRQSLTGVREEEIVKNGSGAWLIEGKLGHHFLSAQATTVVKRSRSAAESDAHVELRFKRCIGQDDMEISMNGPNLTIKGHQRVGSLTK